MDVEGPHRPLPELGDLERALLDCFWDHGEMDVVEAHGRVGASRGIGLNTVGSALERLHRKGLMIRRKLSHAYRYTPALARDTFLARRVIDGVGGLSALARRGLLSRFVDLVADADESALADLEAMIALRRKGGPS